MPFCPRLCQHGRQGGAAEECAGADRRRAPGETATHHPTKAFCIVGTAALPCPHTCGWPVLRWWVVQDTCLFNDTIVHNIKYGRLGAEMNEIEAAVEVGGGARPSPNTLLLYIHLKSLP